MTEHYEIGLAKLNQTNVSYGNLNFLGTTMGKKQITSPPTHPCQSHNFLVFFADMMNSVT